MKNRPILGIVILLAAILSGCAAANSARHQYLMQGQILDMENNVAYLCIGSSDGAKVGQQYTVYKVVKLDAVGKQQSNYKREKTGLVKITEIVDEHFARAEIVSGEAEKHFIVELNP